MRNVILAVVTMPFLFACDGREAKSVPSPQNNPPVESSSDSAIGESIESETPSAEAAGVSSAAPIETGVDEIDWPATALHAKIVTSKGDMLVDLYPEKAPKTVENFVRYARDGHYDRLIIHRVVPGFIIQGGGYNKYFNERPTREPVPYEGGNGLGNFRTTLAMARTSDPDSASAQWYVNLRDNNDQLDHFVNDLGPRFGYTVFGRVVKGMEVADAIGAMPTGAGGPFPAEVPVETVTISRVDIIEGAQ